MYKRKTTKLYDPSFTPQTKKEEHLKDKAKQEQIGLREIHLDETLTGNTNKNAIKEIQESHPYKYTAEELK